MGDIIGKPDLHANRRIIGDIPIYVTMGSVARLFVSQMQDWLELGAESRMNTPGLLSTMNWSWRLTEMPSEELAEEILAMTRRYGRCAQTPAEEDKTE